MAVSSKVGVANLALYGLHKKRISSFNDQTDTAVIIKDIYDHFLEQTITAANWVCCTKRQQLSQDATTPDFGFSYQYILPSDYLKFQEMYDSDEYGLTFKIEFNRLLTDESSFKLLYSFKNEDPTTYSPEFLDTLVARLQAELAYSLTGSVSVADQKWKLYQLKLEEAASSNAVQNYPKEIVVDQLLQVR